MNGVAPLLVLRGTVVAGCGHFSRRIREFPQIFRQATGVDLFPGTINVEVDRNEALEIHEEFRSPDPIDSSQVLLFERCTINGFSGFRIRPFNVRDRSGGHGDHIIEVSSTERIPNVEAGALVVLTFQRAAR